ncbi:hypothetical protein ACFLTU_02335 [Bacteroidota bacterium]
MKDRLEQFISDNRDQFDLYEPDEKLWAGIESNVPRGRTARIGWKGVLWRAAAVLIIFGASFLLQEYLQLRQGILTDKKEDKILREIPELREAEVYYTNLLDEKILQIEPMISDNPELGVTLRQDLSELDSIYGELQKDLRDNIANDEVVEAMIQNYILKIQILEDLLEYMDGTSKNNEDENEAFEI